jgi:hypothetical protein
VKYVAQFEPWQTVVGPVRVGFGDELTTMVIVFDVAGFPVAHVEFEVKIHFTWSLLAGV